MFLGCNRWDLAGDGQKPVAGYLGQVAGKDTSDLVDNQILGLDLILEVD